MTSDFHYLALERDDTLIKGLGQAARTTRLELREWTESELKALLVQAELHENLAEGEIRHQIKRTVERLREITHTDLPEAIRDYDEVMEELSGGGYTDVLDAHAQLEQGKGSLVRIVRDLLKIRTYIGTIG